MRKKMKEKGKVILLLSVIFLAVVFLGLFVTRASPSPPKKGTVLSISPFSFYGGCSTHVLTATLTDANGKPLAGKVIVWSATPSIPGYAPADVEPLVSPIENVTNSLGQASIAYWAPVVDSETTVTIVAEFAGDELYVDSRGVSIGTIVPGSPPPPPVY
jgi:hypothetical protein